MTMLGQADWFEERFEENRSHLRSVAYRMLGSLSDADDAVQEVWLRFERSDPPEIRNLGGWLTTVVSRVCLDMLRSRKARREDSLTGLEHEEMAIRYTGADPEQEAVLADSLGVALLVILDRLTPAERIAFVLHDIVGMPFEEIATTLDRTPVAARQLASRARRRVKGTNSPISPDLDAERSVVEAFLEALRRADTKALLEVLHPDVQVRVDQSGTLSQIRGGENWARDAVAYSKIAAFAEPVLVDGDVGAVFAPSGRLFSVLRFGITLGKITDAEIIVNPLRFPKLVLGLLGS